jgi:hypothetical protein
VRLSSCNSEAPLNTNYKSFAAHWTNRELKFPHDI